MPLCTLHLLSLCPTTSIPSFLSSLHSASLTPIIQSRVIRWIILPKFLSTVPLLAHNTHWDLLILLPGVSALPTFISSQLAAEWHVTVGVPSRLLKDFSTKNNALLNPPAGSVKAAEKPDQTEASSTQNLELTPELASWIDSLPSAQKNHPISMLNLLSFVPGRKEEYLKYGAAFAKSIGSRHGGEAKIVGNVIHQEEEKVKASADGAAAAGYMIPGQAISKSNGKNGSAGASTSGPDASGLIIEDDTADRSRRTTSRAKEGASASGASAAGYMIPDEAQNEKKIPTSVNERERISANKAHTADTSNTSSNVLALKAHTAAYKTPDKAQKASIQIQSDPASAAGYMIPSSSQTDFPPSAGASASAALSSGLRIESESPATSAKWDEIAIAHYPSLSHFAAMAGSKDYQAINRKHRIPSLRDTFILCTMEIADDGELAGVKKRGNARL